MTWLARYDGLAGSPSATLRPTSLRPTWLDSWPYLPRSIGPRGPEAKTMKVTDVDVIRVAALGSIIAPANVVLDNRLYLSGIAVHRKLIGSGIRLVDPACVVDNRPYCLFHPVERSIGQVMIQEAISSKIALTVGTGDA